MFNRRSLTRTLVIAVTITMANDMAMAQARHWTGADGAENYALEPSQQASDADPNKADVKTQLTAMTDGLRKEAAKGHKREMFDLGTLMEQGYAGPAIDLKGAYDLYEAAADKGEERALSRMCVSYLTGWQRPVNLAKGMSYCRQLDDTRPAMIFAGAYDFDKGLTGPADQKQALIYYLTAADGGSADAMDQLGLIMEAQADKAKDAREWYRRATREGSVDAMFNLARMVEKGSGGPADHDEAQWLYANAAQKGHAGAVAWLKNLPTAPVPLRRLSVTNPKDQMITETVNGKAKPFKLLDGAAGRQTLFPRDTVYGKIDGSVVIECYVRDDHRIDVCITEAEFPVGFNYAAVMQTVFAGDMVIAPQTPRGEATAHSVFDYSLTWRIY